MGRPQGSKNRFKPGDPNYKKPGRKPKRLEVVPYEEILEGKKRILEVLSAGEAVTIASAARICGIKPSQAHQWSKTDKEFQELVEMSRQVAADDIEEEFRHHPNFIPKMMLLKGYRPMFRDNYKFQFQSEALENLLQKLAEIAERAAAEQKAIEGEYKVLPEEAES